MGDQSVASCTASPGGVCFLSLTSVFMSCISVNISSSGQGIIDGLVIDMSLEFPLPHIQILLPESQLVAVALCVDKLHIL